MASGAERRRLGAIVIAVGLLSACASDSPASATLEPSTASSAEATPSVLPSPSSSREASPTVDVQVGLALPDPAPPFDPATLLDAMRTSRRPGGVPDQLETDRIAAALADAIWTYGGEPWTTMALHGSCGPQTCTLEAAGTRPGSLGEDLWVFEIVPSAGRVTVASADLAAVPADIVDPLDELARLLVSPGQLDGLILASVRWLPPPRDGLYVLSYRSGGEEGSCGVDLTLDAATPEVVERTFLDC